MGDSSDDQEIDKRIKIPSPPLSPAERGRLLAKLKRMSEENRRQQVELACEFAECERRLKILKESGYGEVLARLEERLKHPIDDAEWECLVVNYDRRTQEHRRLMVEFTRQFADCERRFAEANRRMHEIEGALADLELGYGDSEERQS